MYISWNVKSGFFEIQQKIHNTFGNSSCFMSWKYLIRSVKLFLFESFKYENWVFEWESLPLKLETSMYPLLGETGSGHSISKWSLYEYYRLIILNQ